MTAPETGGQLTPDEVARHAELLARLQANVKRIDVIHSSFRITFPVTMGRTVQEFAALERREFPWMRLSTSRGENYVALTVRVHESKNEFLRERWQAEATLLRLVLSARGGFF